jgi:hypothetical protein
VAAILAATLVVPTVGAAGPTGFKTSESAWLEPGTSAPAGTKIEALLTVGDVIDDFRFDAIPDGIAILPRGRGTVSVLLNHETSTVPFPYNAAAPTSANSFNDFDNSTLVDIRLHQKTAAVLDGQVLVPSESNFQRFCSSYLATAAEGFSRPILFLNEEGIDWVNREGTAWPAVEGSDDARQIGTVVAYDVKGEAYRPIWGMGRLNHENSVAIPGYGHPVLLTGDDTFVSNPAQSQLYSYVADDADAVWNDAGDLWAFKADDAAINDYYDVPVGSTTPVTGRFIKVPREIATGINPDGTEMMAEDGPAALGAPTPEPPNDGTWQRGTSGAGIDGPQWVLEHWGDVNNVFQFVRLEDIAYDKRPGMGNVVYLIDSGRGATSAGGNAFTSSNGRVWRMELDPADPTLVDSLSVLIEGDDNPVKTLDEIHQPDNIESTPAGLYITEDPGSSQQFAAADQGLPNATTGRIWQYRLSDGALHPVLAIDQSADEGPLDVDAATSPAAWGAWEASGIVDVSSVFGPGTFLVDVQAHSIFVETGPGPDLMAPAGPDWTNKREGGQLLLVTIPGG